MATLTHLFIGVLSCLAFVLIARRAGPKRELIIYAVALVAAASIYVGFAIVGGATPRWLAIEAGGLALFSTVALFGPRYGLLALGWAAHSFWDVLLHGVPDVGFVPGWYPTACLGFDLFLAGYLIWRAREGRRPNSESYQVMRVDSRKGVGLFATRKFMAGEGIYRFDYWSREQMPIHVTNHSCEPNASFDEGGMLVAVREIERGEEITYDYRAHPIPAAPWNFRCCCEAEGCAGWIDVRKGQEG